VSPSHDIMMGMFKHSSSEKGVTFYEFLNIIEEENGWVMKVKHFNPDLTGWEEKNDYHTFELISISEDQIAFDGLVIKRISPTITHHLLSIKRGDKVEQEVLEYGRVE